MKPTLTHSGSPNRFEVVAENAKWIRSKSVMADKLRSIDWSRNPLGPVSLWPQSLRTIVETIMASKYLMFVVWGADQIFLYNDAYAPILGAKEPDALGKSFPLLWSEIWTDLLPLVEAVRSGEATRSDDLRLFMTRNGYFEECYFTFSYSPVRDDEGKIAGLFCAGAETTQRVLSERRSLSIQQLTERVFAAEDRGAIFRSVQSTLAENPSDIPFSLIFSVDSKSAESRVEAVTGTASHDSFAMTGELRNSVAETLRTGEGRITQVRPDFFQQTGQCRLAPDQCRAWIAPIIDRSGRPLACAVFGISPNLDFATDYSDYFKRIAAQIGGALQIKQSQTAVDHARRESELANQRLRLTIEALPQGIWRADPDGAADYVSERFCALVGYSADRLLSWNWADLIHPADRERVVSAWQTSRDAQAPVSVDFRFRRDDGSYRWYLSEGNPYFDDQGRMIKYYGTWTDISARKDTEEALMIEGDKLKAVIESVEAGIGLTDATGRILSLNPEGLRIHGFASIEEMYAHLDEYTREFELQFPDGTVIPLESWPLARVIRGEDVRDEDIRLVRRRDGHAKSLIYSATPVRNTEGEVIHYVFSIKDVTALKHAMNAAIHEREFLSKLIERLPVMITVYDPQLRAFRFNDEFKRILGWTEDDASRSDFMSLVYPDPEARSEALEFMTSGSTGWHEFTVSSRMGEPIPSSWANLRMTDETQVGIGIDLRERKRIEQALKESKDAAESASSLKTAFLANMSHEIRTPLGAILGFAELLKDAQLSEVERAEYLDIVIRSGHSLTRIIDDILDLSKVEAGQLQIEKTLFSVSDVANEVMDLFREKARSKGIELSLDLPPNGPFVVNCDPTRLRQILINIVGNAVKFTEKGRVRISVASTPVDHERWRFDFRVDDTGPGLTQEQAERIFQPFMQADNSTTRRFGGTGLGLALSKRLAQALGGDISLERTGEGQGCTFTLSIVAETVGSNESRAKANSEVHFRAPNSELGGIRVLLVEDSPDNRVLVSRMLTKKGAHVECADDGLQGAEKALSRTYDVVLMDIQMPNLDGYQATRKLRAAGFDRPIIALTAHAMLEERQKTKAAGCDAHLTKPLDPKLLTQTILDFTYQ